LIRISGFRRLHRQLVGFLDDVYNRARIHSLLGDLTLAEFEQQGQAEVS